MKRVAINQSNYIPWKGYFDIIHDVDLFIFYDDVQYTKNDWRNRNQVKTPAGLQWLTIPTGSDLRRRICDVSIESAAWQRKHWQTLMQLYRRAPFFGDYSPSFAAVYGEHEWRNLSELNQFLIRKIAHDFLGIQTPMRQSSDFTSSGRSQDRLLSLLKAVQADLYVSGPAGKAYIEEERFREAGIEIIWKDYSGYPEYSQFHPPFQHAVTILDLLFHTGPRAPFYIWGWRDDQAPVNAASEGGRSRA